jgi:hypothetical protein
LPRYFFLAIRVTNLRFRFVSLTLVGGINNSTFTLSSFVLHHNTIVVHYRLTV